MADPFQANAVRETLIPMPTGDGTEAQEEGEQEFLVEEEEY